MKLFGYKRWFEREKEGEKYKIKQKLRKEDYKILIDEDNNSKDIENEEFIENLKNYKTKGNKIGNKFSELNILFKIKKDKKFEDISILKQSKKLGEWNKGNKNSTFTRTNYEKKINEMYKSKENDLLERDFSIEEIKIGNESIDVYFDYEKFNKNKDKTYCVLCKKYEEDEKENREEIYKCCKKINEELYNILGALIKEKCDKRKQKLFYKEKIDKHKIKNIKEQFEKINKIKKEFKKIKEKVDKDKIEKEIKNTDNMFCQGLNFYLNLNKKKISDEKQIFARKIENYLKYDIELSEEDIKDFLVEECMHYDILKRQEYDDILTPKIVNPDKESWKKKWKKSWERTYIKNDKHTSYLNDNEDEDKNIVEKIKDNGKIDVLKIMIDNKGKINKIIDEIYEKYEIEKLEKELEKELKNDTNLFKVYKEHYKKVGYKIEKYLNEDENLKHLKKIIAKLIYRYLKGRIEKIITYDCKNNIEDIFSDDKLKKKLKRRVEQYIIENLIYLGKVKIINDQKSNENSELKKKNIIVSFKEYGIKEELELEFLNLVSATNLSLNELLNTSKDYFGSENSKFEDSEKKKLKCRFNFNEDSLEKYRMEMIELRSNIIHRGNAQKKNKSIFDYYKNNKDNTAKLEEDYKNLKEIIEDMKISDEYICENLNFDIIFKNNEKTELIKEINELSENSKKDTIYFPNFSKLIPQLESKLRESVSDYNFSNKDYDILKNAYIYLHKILYYKQILIWENADKISMEKLYKKAQIKASKGEKNAIKKFQNKFIEEYLEKIKNDFKNIFDFEYLKGKNITEELRKARETKTSIDEKYILQSIEKDIKIENDFEYIVVKSALLMKDNTYINKFRNRLFATYSWLKPEQDSEIDKMKNLIDILDEIIAINKNKIDYKNKIDIKELKNKIETLENKIKTGGLTREDSLIIIEDKLTKDKIKKEYKKLLEKKELKELLIKKELTKDYCIKNDKKSYIQVVIKINELDEEIDQNLKDFIDKILNNKKIEVEKYFEKYLQEGKIEIFKQINKLLKYKESIYGKYMQKIEEIIKEDNEKKFEDIYYQKVKEDISNKKTAKNIIYKNNLLYSTKSFNKNYKEFLEEDIKSITKEDTDLIKDNNKDIAKTIKKVNNVLTKINKLFKGCSKKYKDAFKKGIESKNDFFKTNGYDSYDDFKKDFDKIEEYKKKKAIVEMAIIGKIHNYLVEINWKLAIQISRIERDVDYIYTGLKELYEGISDEDITDEEKLKKRIEIICSTLVEDNKDETKNDNKLFEDLTILKNELTKSEKKNEKKNEEKSIRNYIAHFHLLQNPFKDKNLKEIIDRVNEISKYRSRYKNIVYNICFEVFKKDLELNYKMLKKRFRLSENTQNDDKIFEIKDLLSSKKISVLELETGKELLKKVEKLFEYKYF